MFLVLAANNFANEEAEMHYSKQRSVTLQLLWSKPDCNKASIHLSLADFPDGFPPEIFVIYFNRLQAAIACTEGLYVIFIFAIIKFAKLKMA